jgi:hypothetical protein
MKWQVRIVAGTGFLVAIGILLFPRWLWTDTNTDARVVDGESQVSFVSRRPSRYAHIDLQLIGCLELGILTLTLGAIVLSRQRVKDEQVMAHWRTKWDYTTNNPDTLLRASGESVVQSRVLLRAAKSVESPKEELLRVPED